LVKFSLLGLATGAFIGYLIAILIYLARRVAEEEALQFASSKQ
jgi:hypothetical protein